MIQMDASKLDEARQLVARAHEMITLECRACDGTGGSSSYHCPTCGGEGRVTGKKYEFFRDGDRVDYWQARALVAEVELAELKDTFREADPDGVPSALVGRIAVLTCSGWRE